MEEEKLKEVWANTIASNQWDEASVHVSYGDRPPHCDTEDYAPGQRQHHRPLPYATFTTADVAPNVSDSRKHVRTIVVVDENLDDEGGVTLGPASLIAEGGETLTYDQAMVDPATIIIASEESRRETSQYKPSLQQSNASAQQAPLGESGGVAAALSASGDSDRGAQLSANLEARSALQQAGHSYEIMGEIGRGGMGVIYRAVQGSLEREVAVKTLLADKTNHKSREKFVAEALVTGSLDHPNVVPVHELGRNQDGEVFLAMKLVDGCSWKRLLHPRTDVDKAAAASYTIERHIDVLLDVTNAISFAHSKGVIHRDLKPENIMVGAYGETLVMDWGIAVDIREPEPLKPLAPHRSTVIGPAGTPVYMSPEQAEGRGSELSEQTDVYLLGAILHEIVTGKAPHQRRGLRLMEVLLLARNSQPATYDESVPKALQEICHKAMAPLPADRYSSVAAFREALSTWLGHRGSLKLTDEADTLFAKAVAAETAPDKRYGLFTRSLARYEQALLAWGQNPRALRGQNDAALAYAEEALARKDFGVVEAQLGLVNDNPGVDQARVGLLRAALKRQRASRLRTAAALVLIVGATASAYQGLAAVAEQGAAEGAATAAQHAFDRKAQDAWKAVLAGDLLEVSRAETRLAEDPKAREPEGRDRINAVRGAKKLMLWQQRRWQELFTIQCRDFRAGLLEAGGRDPEVTGALAKTRVGELLRRAADDPSSRSLCKIFESELIGGTPAKTILHAFDQMQSTAPARAQKRLLRRRRLLDAATCEMAPIPLELALKSTETDACLLKSLPFVLARPPVGPLQKRRSRRPVMRRGKHQEWVALDRDSRRELWRTNPPGEDRGSEVVVPVADGSVIIGNSAFLRRYDGRTGKVLGRIVLPSEPILAWPDSLDRRRLRAIVWTNREQGRVGVVSFVAGRQPRLAFKADTFEAWGRTSPLVMALERRQREALASELGVAVDSDDERLRSALFKKLIAQARRDPYEPDFGVRALHVIGTQLSAEKRARVADHVVRSSKGLIPGHAVRIGIALWRQGFKRRANQLFDQAAHDFLDGHGNPDLAGFRAGNPANMLRRLGAALYAEGKTEEALQLVKTGRRFATVMEGDTVFYERWLRWLKRMRRRDEGGSVARFAGVAARMGGMLVLAPIDFLLTDVAAFIVVLAPLLLLLLLARLSWRARRSRIAALHAHGMRSGRARAYGFFADPWLRARHTFWSYATRGQRLLVLCTAALAILSATTLISNLSILSQTTTAPLHLAFGFPGQPAFLADARIALERDGKRPALLRLMAEGLRARGRLDDAQKSLEQAIVIDPDDARSLNNLGVLHERAKRSVEARASYQRSAALSGAGAAAARWNLARLQQAELPTSDLAHRDRLRARRYGAKKPLWALCSLQDQRALVAPRQTLAERATVAFSQLLRGDFVILVGRENDLFGDYARHLRTLMGGALLLCLLCGVVALIWLPLTTLPLLPARHVGAGRKSARATIVSRTVALLFPGARWLMRERVAIGGALMLSMTVLLGLWLAIDVHGFASALVDIAADVGFFTEVELPSVHSNYRLVGQGSLVALAGIYLVNGGLEMRSLLRRR